MTLEPEKPRDLESLLWDMVKDEKPLPVAFMLTRILKRLEERDAEESRRGEKE